MTGARATKQGKSLICGDEPACQSSGGRDAPLCPPGFAVRDSAEGHRPGPNREADLTLYLSQELQRRSSVDEQTIAAFLQIYLGIGGLVPNSGVDYIRPRVRSCERGARRRRGRSCRGQAGRASGRTGNVGAAKRKAVPRDGTEWTAGAPLGATIYSRRYCSSAGRLLGRANPDTHHRTHR